MEKYINIEEKFKILNDSIEEIPIEYIRQIKITYDSKYISYILLKILNVNNDNNKKLLFNKLKYQDYLMEDLYYLISKIANIINNTHKISYFPNYKKDGFNIFINKQPLLLYQEDDIIIIEFI